ncbi:MAG: hypothetical protein WCV84_01010 [Patescibacteria group bacterium]
MKRLVTTQAPKRSPFWRYLKISLLVFGLVILGLILFLFVGRAQKQTETVYGVTWSATYARYLGIDPVQGLETVLNELGVRDFRIPAYWTEVEPSAGNFTFDTVRAQLDAIAQRGGTAIVCLGGKQPRWPEWWIPEWIKTRPAEEMEVAQRNYVERTFQALAWHPAIVAWQVESEPSFSASFGHGVKQREAFLREEMQLVRQLETQYATYTETTPRPIFTTESGELSWWGHFGNEVDGIGTSVYRTVLMPGGYVLRYWFLPPWFYARKALLVRPWVKEVFVSEFQMEPWVPGGIIDATLDQQFRTFDLEQMQKNFHYAERMPQSPIYFWGVEWWLWMKDRHSHPEFWETAKRFFAK